MNNKGQMTGLGILFVVFVAVVVAVAMLTGSGGIASNVASVTDTINVVNQSVVTPNVGVTSNGLLRGKAVSNVLITNASQQVVPATNYTITNYVVGSDGVLTVAFRSNGGGLALAGNTTKVSYTYEPLGYATDAGARSIASIIIILVCLAIGVIALVPTLRSGVLDYIGR
jgi:hypothetical protein